LVHFQTYFHPHAQFLINTQSLCTLVEELT
jgi:hypothetical protein